MIGSKPTRSEVSVSPRNPIPNHKYPVVDEIVDMHGVGQGHGHAHVNAHGDNLPKYFGKVKWWNDKLGFGFATILDGPTRGREVFIHHTSIVAPVTSYRSLRKNDFVSFNVTRGINGEQAINVCSSQPTFVASSQTSKPS